MTYISVLPWASTLLGISAFLIYNLGVIHGRAPNATAWLIWSFGGLVSASSYFVVTGSVLKSMLLLTDVSLCFTVLLVGLLKRNFVKPALADYLAIAGTIITAAVWVIFRNANIANLLIQIVGLIGFIPIIFGVYSRRLQEDYLPWLIWSVAYLLTGIFVLADYDGNPLILINPLFIGFFMHGLIGVLALQKNCVRRSS